MALPVGARPSDLGTFAVYALEFLVFPALDADQRIGPEERDELRDFDRSPRPQIVHDAALIGNRDPQQSVTR